MVMVNQRSCRQSTMALLFRLVLITLIVLQTQSGILQITLNNLKNVLAAYQQLTVLFHNPQCLHSRKYAQQFLKVTPSDETKLGIVDCIRELQLCQQHNLTTFPILAKYTLNQNSQTNQHQQPQKSINHFQIIDEQQFLVNHQLKSQQDDQVIANKFVSLLTHEPYYAIVVLQDFELPVTEQQRLSPKQQPRLFYLQPYNQYSNPSQFTKLISSFVQNRQGCWIFKKSTTNQLQKYSCDTGYNKEITLRYIRLFTENKRKKYIFQHEAQQSRYNEQTKITTTNINTKQLTQILRHDKDSFRPNACGIVYVSSKHCVSCRQKDIPAVVMAISQLGWQKQLEIFQFDIDKNQIPPIAVEKGLKRVPQFIYVCEKRVRLFGKVLFVEEIKKFIQESRQLNTADDLLSNTAAQAQINKKETLNQNDTIIDQNQF